MTNEMQETQVLSAERLHEITHRAHEAAKFIASGEMPDVKINISEYGNDVLELLSERHGLILNLAQLSADNDRRDFLQMVASDHEHKWRGEHCKICHVEFSTWTAQIQFQARALLKAASASGEGSDHGDQTDSGPAAHSPIRSSRQPATTRPPDFQRRHSLSDRRAAANTTVPRGDESDATHGE